MLHIKLIIVHTQQWITVKNHQQLKSFNFLLSTPPAAAVHQKLAQKTYTRQYHADDRQQIKSSPKKI